MLPHPGLFPPVSLGIRHTWERAQAGSSLAIELKEAYTRGRGSDADEGLIN